PGTPMLYCECPCVCCDTQVFLLPDGATGEGIPCPSCSRPLRSSLLQAFGEAGWLASDSPGYLACFEQVRRGATRRKRRLFAVACCRLVWHLLKAPRSRAEVEEAERAADRPIGEVNPIPAHAVAWDVAGEDFPREAASLSLAARAAAADDSDPA